MPPEIVKQVVHRPGPLKQSNKAHKGGKSKGKRHGNDKLSVKVISRHRKHELNRIDRRNQMNQLRKVKREEVLKLKGRLGGLQSAPILSMLLSLDDSIDPVQFLDRLKSIDDDLVVTQSSLGHCHIIFPRLKQRFTFLIPCKSDLHSVMDALKVSETLLLLHSSNAPDEYTEMLLSIILGHAVPTPVHVIQGLEKLNPKKKAECRKNILKRIEQRFPDAKLYSTDTQQDFQLLLRQIGNQKQRAVAFRDNRFHLLAENVDFEQSDADSNKGTLKVEGYIRGQPLNVNGLIHLPGWGTYQMSRLYCKHDPHASASNNNHLVLGITEEADPIQQESLQSEVIPDPMEGEQTWPTQEELDEANKRPKKIVKKVAEGTSEYQACWIIDSENEVSDVTDDEDESSDKEPEEMSEGMEIMDDTESAADIKDEDYDKNIDMDEEKKTLVRFKEERMNEMFPDEQDTPLNISARVRYQRYRGLKNFNRSPWDPMENLPDDYARIYRFQNFRQAKKKALRAEKEGADPGEYVEIYIKDVPRSLYDNVNVEKPTIVIYGLLPHEQKMSVVNTVIWKHATCETSIKSKDKLIFHMGYLRFTCEPLFSEHKTGNKFKFERFLPSNAAVIASFYAPVIFPPTTVVVFRQKPNGCHELVATGSVLDANPNRVVVKRVVLSGHPFKISKRAAVVKYMFFNKEDIHWFKCVELRSKYGRHGHIKDSIGSHGHMKCLFDQQLPSQDVVTMCLYKRVFPKWTYDPYVPTPLPKSHCIEEDLESMI